MPAPSSVTIKAARLVAEIQMLEARPHTACELARSLGVSVRSVQRDLVLLQTEPLYVPLWQDHRMRWRILRMG